MKNLTRIATTILLGAALMCACSKGKDGRDGQDGGNGTNGINGEKGEKGDPGNANVKMYKWGERTFTTFTTYEIPIPFEEIENYLIYAYAYLEINLWVPVPVSVEAVSIDYVLGKNGNNTDLGVIITLADGSDIWGNPITFDAFRVIAVPIPEENITEYAGAGGTGSKGAAPDYSNYAEVAEYYGLPQ